MRKLVKIIGGLFVAFIIIGVIAGASSNSHSGSTSSPALVTPTSPATTTATPQEMPLKVVGDAQGIRANGPTMMLTGSTAPGAIVNIEGVGPEPIEVHANKTGDFRAKVSITLGDNNFNVSASAPGFANGSDTTTITRVQTAAEKQAAAARAEAHRQAVIARRAAQKQAYINSAATIPYNELSKDADAQAGKVVTYTGQIFQIQEDPSGGGMMLVSVTDEGYGLWDNHIWVDYSGHVSGAEGDTVTFYGTVVGSKSYDTQAGGTTYVPEVNAKYTQG
jgi:hypothetical protein